MADQANVAAAALVAVVARCGLVCPKIGCAATLALAIDGMSAAAVKYRFEPVESFSKFHISFPPG